MRVVHETETGLRVVIRDYADGALVLITDGVSECVLGEEMPPLIDSHINDLWDAYINVDIDEVLRETFHSVDDSIFKTAF